MIKFTVRNRNVPSDIEYLARQKFYGFDVEVLSDKVRIYIKGDGDNYWLIATVGSEFIADEIINKIYDKLKCDGIIDIDKIIVGR